ncbi:sugar phosphate isomerase/epimerase family protein [Stratiformator vulcanicus]|uniref:D-tagatose 3-epimerase n=1 Tax=Stratiformator vulcanicus TaxID=2527980 RepID=A0A517R5Y0_9PLAN|nr:sugar phosphate isomerase/epimerase family protein [Stratiformator vulcanicus]QDT39270.1 D-tagatose 3-epimerase [Stratiformator vulcanicus]
MKSCITISLVEEARGGPFVLWDGLRAGCELAAKLGYDAVEVFPPGPEAVEPGELESLLDDNGLKLAAVGTGAGWVKHKLQLADADESKRMKAIEFVRSIIDFAGPFGAVAIIGSMQGRYGDGVDRESARGYLADALEDGGSHAEQYNVPLIYEPLNRYETNQVNTVADGVGLLNRLSTQNVKLLCDLFHMNIEEEDVADALRTGGDKVGHIHFVDSNRRPVGLGHTDFRPIMAALQDIKYSGYLSAEAFPYPDSTAATEQTIRAFRYWTQS